MCGIYMIKSPSGGFYIGSTARTFRRRFYEHRNSLRNRDHGNPVLQAAADKYGVDALTFEVVEECDPMAVLEREQHYIDTLKPRYNIAKSSTAFFQGRSHSAESRAAIGEKLRGISRSAETRERMSKAQKGLKKPSRVPRKPVTAEHRLSMSIAAKKRGATHSKLSDEDVLTIKRALAIKPRPSGLVIELARKFDVDRTSIQNIAKGKTWSHLKLEDSRASD